MKKNRNHNGFFYRNSLSIAFLFFMIISMAGQIQNGWKEHNDFLIEHKRPEQSVKDYISSGHFIQATFENWESEFLQMALFVILTIHLRQVGSSESKRPGEIDKADERPLANSPWPVKKGGLALAIYRHSLSISLLFLFAVSFVLHWYGSWIDFEEKQLLEGKHQVAFMSYLSGHKFWFESFQNWQSEFLSVFAIIFLSIYLRQSGSPQSKPVNSSYRKTGES